jgi:hypothetical protein
MAEKKYRMKAWWRVVLDYENYEDAERAAKVREEDEDYKEVELLEISEKPMKESEKKKGLW